MNKNKILVPLFLIYLLVGILFIKNNLYNDESRYWKFATNITHGFYTSTDNIDLTNGPGYPLIILPFVYLNSPPAIPKYLNILMVFFAIVFFYKTLKLYLNEKLSLKFTLILGLYIPIYLFISKLETEALTYFLLSSILYQFCYIQNRAKYNIRRILWLSFTICFLAMTKIFFGFVIAFSLLSFIILYLINRDNTYKVSIQIFTLALIFCLPYLVYTYTLTGKIFYWSTNGGDTLYSSVSPYPNEYGDYIIGPDIFDTTTTISKNHYKFVNPIKDLSQFKRDQIYKAKAIKILKAHPFKYFSNWLNNLGRLFFNYPYSYTQQKPTTFFYMIPNSFVCVCSILLIYPFWLNRKKIPREIKIMLLFVGIYLGGTSLIDAESRHFVVVVPIIMFGIFYILSKIIDIKIVKSS